MRERRRVIELIAAVRSGDTALLPSITHEMQSIETINDREAIGHAASDLTINSFMDPVAFPAARVGITATFNADPITPLLRSALLAEGFVPSVVAAPAYTLAETLLNTDSEIVCYRPALTLALYHDRVFLPEQRSIMDFPRLEQVVHDRFENMRSVLRGYSAATHGIIAINTIPLGALERNSLIGFKERARLGVIWRELNARICDLASEMENLHILDVEALAMENGTLITDPRIERFAGMAWSQSLLDTTAREAARLYRAAAGRSRKCLVLDLDDTLWGGALAEQGAEGIIMGELYPGNCYTDLQQRVKMLSEQGVTLAVCSKNDEDVVRRTLREHTGLRVHADDFAAVVANWSPKPEGLRAIAEDLNLKSDAFVFVDDNRFECALVRENLPDIAVLELNDEPADHACRLLSGKYFDVLRITQADLTRARSYRTSAVRKEHAQTFKDAHEYLASLDIHVRIFSADGQTRTRLEQLNGRSNQFNLTKHQLETNITESRLLFGFDVRDRFGEDGIIGGFILNMTTPTIMSIGNLFMSCRVSSRNIEHAVMQWVVERACTLGYRMLHADFIPSPKNDPARSFLESIGFRLDSHHDISRLLFRLPLIDKPNIAPSWIEVHDDTY